MAKAEKTTKPKYKSRTSSSTKPISSTLGLAMAQQRCKVCNSPHLDEINAILKDSGLSIEKTRVYCLETWDEAFTRRSLYCHRNKHMDVELLPTTAGEILAKEKDANSIKNIQDELNRRYDAGEIDVHNNDAMLNHLIAKSLQFIRMLEKASPQQMSHQNIQKYMHEIRECVKLLRGDAENVNVVNVQMINTEVVSILRTVADVVRDVMPERYGVFMERLRDRMRSIDTSIINTENPIEPLPLTVKSSSTTMTLQPDDGDCNDDCDEDCECND